MSRGSILLVDDDKDILALFHMALNEDGYKVDTAVNGSQALAKAMEGSYDLVILDVVLPDIRGDALALKIKECNELANLIFITGYSNMQSCIDSLPIGVSDILLKPITLDELKQTVNNSFNSQLDVSAPQS